MSADKLKKLLDIGRQLAETRVLDPLLESAMSLALDFVGAEYGYIVLLDKDNLVFRVGQHKDGNRLKEPQEQISRTIFNEVIKSGKGKITEDAINSFNTDSVLDLRIRSVICVPLVSRGKVLGAAYVENRSAGNLFDEEDLELLEYFSAQAAVSIENAILNEELEARVEARTVELSRANEKLYTLAVTDSLTGVYNRHHFFELAAKELSVAQRYQHTISAIMLDLDFFKQINDQYGHLVGDRVLQDIAKYIGDSIREVDVLGRYGGEEFAILLPNTSIPGTREIAERVCKMIDSQPVQIGEISVSVTASLGVVSLVNTNNITVEVLLDRADQALYTAKQAGRNQVVVWEEK